MFKVGILEKCMQQLIEEKSKCEDQNIIAYIDKCIAHISNTSRRISRYKYLSSIFNISKRIIGEENTPTVQEQEYLINVINALFASTASMHIEKVDDNLTVEIFDSILEKIVLVLSFKHYGSNLYLQSYQLGVETDPEVKVQSQSHSKQEDWEKIIKTLKEENDEAIKKGLNGI